MNTIISINKKNDVNKIDVEDIAIGSFFEIRRYIYIKVSSDNNCYCFNTKEMMYHLKYSVVTPCKKVNIEYEI